jgi:hypothetical protein
LFERATLVKVLVADTLFLRKVDLSVVSDAERQPKIPSGKSNLN